MKKFCEEEYDHEKFMQYSRRGQKEYSVLKDADSRQTSDKFIPLVVDGPAEFSEYSYASTTASSWCKSDLMLENFSSL